MKAVSTSCLLLLATISLWSPGAQKQQKLDLNGKWKTDQGEEVVISASGGSLTATFVSGADCKWGGTRDFYIQGSLQGNTLSGTMKRCSLNQQLLQDCHLTDPYSAKFEATVEKNTISGTSHPDYINYDVKDGHYINCRITTGGGGPASFSLRRECAPDKGGRCGKIGQAVQTITAAEQPAGSAALYQSLQQDLGAQLDQLRNDLCDDQAAQQQLEDVRKALDSLNYSPGQSNTQNNLALLHVEDGLRGLNQKECGAPPPSQNGACATSEKKSDQGDEEAAKFIKEKFKEALDKVKETAREMQDHGATVPQQIKDQIKNFEKAVNFWNQIKAGSCVPPNVLQTMQQVMNDRRTEGYSENCPAMCSALRKWFESLIGQSNSVQGKLFMDDCLARCD
jgi:hypothetical protein